MNDDLLKQLRTIMREEMHLAFDAKFEQIDKHFEEANDKIDTLITEVDDVRRLTQANYELTKFVLEKHDTQIVEIQTHLNLPTNPTKPLP